MMNFTPSCMSIQIAWIRFDEDAACPEPVEWAGARADAGRRIATDPINSADATKLITSTA